MMHWEGPFFVFATFVDLSAALWIFGAVFTDRMQRMPRWHVAGLTTGAAGLVWQAFRNIHFLVTGEALSDSDIPLWFLKDLGYAMIAYHSVWLVATGQLQLNFGRSTQPPKPAKKAAPKKATLKKPASPPKKR